ncbi:TldD/PmbA family protein [Roseovarius sp. TE539]|uniref:TldD/PmbA family protein n=1 Tax=Roseovarius sp. TE539 TaxID=2249812 RepID=UPI000DE1263E|nr:metallopeptidase TldD-related protein [Roseovarius sp. TE539]RBI77000.1 TldD/PmbA family protein [Roseovarius sp. TE539]
MTDTLEDLTGALLSEARMAGAEAADAIAVSGRSVSVGVRAGTLEEAERAEATDLGLRVLIGGRQACVSASDTRRETLAALAERAVTMAREAPEDPHAGLADASELCADRDPGPLEMSEDTPEPAPEALERDALEAEAAALAVPGVTQVQQAGAGHGRRQIHMAATNGFSGGFARSENSLHCVAIAGEGTGMERDHDGDARVFRTDMRGATEIGVLAGQRAAERISPRRPPTGAWPVLYDERVSASLIGHLLVAANGSSVARGASWLIGRMDTPVLSDGLSLIEDPRRKRAFGSRPFDAEGLQARRREIVSDGILKGWVLDLATARKLGLASTGNAQRGTSAPPSPASWNVALTQGTHSRDDLIAEMGTGFLVTSLIGSTINPNTGDYSRGAAGFWVENGEIAFPVNECTIAGSLPAMLRRMTAANDARPHLTRVVPSLLVEGMTLAGG